MVLSWAELRNERATEIMAQIDPQYAFWSSIIYMHPDRTRRTFELVNIVLQFCVYVEMRFKHALACWRPVEYNAQVQPMITTPGHGSFPSGHATQAYAVAHVLKALLKLNPRTRACKGDRPARPAGGPHRDQPCRCGSPFPGRQHGGAHAGRGFGRVFRRALHTGPDIQGRSSSPRGSTALPPPTSIRSTLTQTPRCRRAVLLIRGSERHEVQFDGAVWERREAEWKANFPRRSIILNPKRRTFHARRRTLPEMLRPVPPVRDLDGLQSFEFFRRRNFRLFLLVEFKGGRMAARRSRGDGEGTMFASSSARPTMTAAMPPSRAGKSVVLDREHTHLGRICLQGRAVASAEAADGSALREALYVDRWRRQRSPGSLLIGVLDDGCPFAAAHFLRPGGRRKHAGARHLGPEPGKARSR